ncbi:MAG: S1/P1 nuclease [Limisphaerales bacterium]
MPSACFAWGREGHESIVIVAEHFLRPEIAERMRELLAPESPEAASVWADEYRRDHRETGPWHYIDIPLAESRIDLARECRNGDCVIAKTEEFLAVLRDPRAEKEAKAQALRFVIHFVGDLHQPLHVADDGDEDGNRRGVIFEGHPDNLHWVWDTGLLQRINRKPAALAMELEGRITLQDQTEWQKGIIEDWAMEGHRIAQTVAYGDLSQKIQRRSLPPTSGTRMRRSNFS